MRFRRSISIVFLCVILIAVMFTYGLEHRDSSAKTGKPGWTVMYNKCWGGFYLFHPDSKKKTLINWSDSNGLVQVHDSQTYAEDTYGTTVYQFKNAPSEIKHGTRNILDVARFIAKNDELLLIGSTLDKSRLLVRKKGDLYETLYVWDPWKKTLKELPLNSCGCLPSPPTISGHNSLFAYTYYVQKGNMFDATLGWLVLHVYDVDNPKKEINKLVGVGDAAWRRDGNSILVVIEPKHAKKLNLSSNLAEWDFRKNRFTVMGKGYGYVRPIVDMGPEVMIGQNDTHHMTLISPPGYKSLYKKTSLSVGKGWSISNPYITRDKRYLFFLAWRNPKPYHITRYASLKYFDFLTGKVHLITTEANEFVVFE